MEWPTSTARLVVLVPLAIIVGDIIRRIVQARIERKGYPFPPGPTPLPIIGNILSVGKEPWLTYTDWKEKYGDIMYLRLFDTDVIVLNSPSVAIELLDKRSQIYSDRPFIATVDPFGHDCNFAFTQYGDYWRLCRRIFHQTFRAEAALVFRPMQLHRARRMIVNMIDDSEQWTTHFATFASAVAMNAVYDYEPSPRNDPIVSVIEKFLHISVPRITIENAVLIKTFPFLLHVPDWFPGSWLKREAKQAYEWRNMLIDMPYQYIQKRMESGDYTASAMVADHTTRLEKLDESYRSSYETALKNTSAAAIIGATVTTSSTFMVFTLAMIEHPDVCKRAQAEIDTVVGRDRLPEFDDRDQLPYVDAIIREVSRWKPVGPLGIPHGTSESDVYNGYYIPKGATVLRNVWAMSRDPDRYPDPEKFLPERFLDADGMLTDDDPAQYIFGFGRRVCPGRHTADASLWSGIVTMLATLNFNLAKDENGNDITFTATFTDGVTLQPDPFPCSLTPRAHITKEYLERILSK